MYQRRKDRTMSIRVVSFILMFLVLHVRDSRSIAQTEAPGQALIPETRELPTAGRRSTRMNVEEKIYGGVPAEAVYVGKGLGSGRKMMIKRDMGMVKDEGLKGDDLKIRGSAASYVGIQNVNCKLRIKAVPRPKDDVKMAGFVAFNADYHVPKPHPPKNN